MIASLTNNRIPPHRCKNAPLTCSASRCTPEALRRLSTPCLAIASACVYSGAVCPARPLSPMPVAGTSSSAWERVPRSSAPPWGPLGSCAPIAVSWMIRSTGSRKPPTSPQDVGMLPGDDWCSPHRKHPPGVARAVPASRPVGYARQDTRLSGWCPGA